MNDILYDIQNIVDRIYDKSHILENLIQCFEKYNTLLSNVCINIDKCNKGINDYMNELNSIQLESDLIKNICDVLINKLNCNKESLKQVCSKKNNLKEYIDITFNSTEWIKNFNKSEERKEIINEDIKQCTNLVSSVTNENNFNELYINKIVNYINDSLNYWLEEVQDIEGSSSYVTKFPLYKIDTITIKSSDELDKLFIEKILISSLRNKYEKRKLQFNNIKKILLNIPLKNKEELNNETELIENRLNKDNFNSWLLYYNEYLKNINSNENYDVSFINGHNKSKDIYNYISNYRISLKDLKKLQYENMNENDKIEKVPDEIFSVVINNLENEIYRQMMEKYEKLWNIECDFINLIKYNESSYEKLYKLYNEINSYNLKYSKEDSINIKMIDQCKIQLDTFEDNKVELEQEILFKHNQYNKVKDLENENNQSVNELNNYILENQKKYLAEINNLVESFSFTLKDIIKKYEEKCKNIINEFMNIQSWIQNLQNDIKQYATSLPPKPLFNILGNIILIENDEDLDNFYNNINQILNSTVDESNTIIDDCKNHYEQIKKSLNQKLDDYDNIFMEYKNEEKIASMKVSVNKSFDSLKEDLLEYNNFILSSTKLVDVEKKSVSLYSKYTYVQHSLKSINNLLKNSEINTNILNDCRTKIKEIEKKYLVKSLNSDYDDCENLISIYNENYYDKTNKKEFVKLLISKMTKSLKDIQVDIYEKYNKLLDKLKYCTNFLNEYEIYENKILNINSEIEKMNDFSCENNICKLQISDYKKVFNEILSNIKSMEMNECEAYIKRQNIDQKQNINGIKNLIDSFNDKLKIINDNINNYNIEHNLINEIYNNRKELKEIEDIMFDIKTSINEFKKVEGIYNKIEMKTVFENLFKRLDKSLKKLNKISDINEKYQEYYKNMQKYEKLVSKIQNEEDKIKEEIKKLKNQWKEISNLINKLEEEEKLRKMLEELHKNTKEDEKEYIRELSYLNEISPDKVSIAELNNEIQKLNKIFDWIDSKLFDDNFKDYKWEGDPDNLKKMIQNTLDKLNSISSINKCISNTQFLTTENNKKLDNFKFEIDNNRKKIAMIINNIIQNGLLHQQNLEKLRLNIHSLSQELKKTNKELQSNDKKVIGTASKNEEYIERYKEVYSSIINTLSDESNNLKEIKREYEELINDNNEFLTKINEGFNWYKSLIKINNDYIMLKDKIINCNEIEEIFSKYDNDKKSKLDLDNIFNSIYYKINIWKNDKYEIVKEYEENIIIPFNSIDEFIDINNGSIDINIYKMNDNFNQLDIYISKRETQFKNVNSKLKEIIDKNDENIKQLLNDLKNILSKENILKYSQYVSSSSEEKNILESNYKSYEIQYNEVNKNMNCLLEITSMASEIFTSKGSRENIENLPINIYQLLMSLLNNPQNIWDYKELNIYNDLIQKSIEIIYSYKSKYNDINNIINNIKLINIKKDESNIPIKMTELKLYKAQIKEYENSYNKELEEYNKLNDQYINEIDEHVQYLITCIKKEFLMFIEKTNNLIKDINNNIESEFNNLESLKKNENDMDDVKKWILDKKQFIKMMEDDLPPSETLIPLENIVNFSINENFQEYNTHLKERIDFNISKGKEKLKINNKNCNLINDEIIKKKDYVNEIGRSLNYNKTNETIKDLNDLNENKEDLKILCNFTKLFIDFQEIVYLLYGELLFINNQVNSLHLKYKEADNSNMTNPMNTIEELNKKFKAIEEVIKNIQNDGIYKNYEINQKILYKNVLFKISKKEIILQHIIKETKTINELQRKININYEKIKDRNSLFKEIILKIDSCEENYKKVTELLDFIDNSNNNFSQKNSINSVYRELKEHIDSIDSIMDEETKNINIIDSLIINNKIKYLNNKVSNLKTNINKRREDVNDYHNLLKQLEQIMNLENMYSKIKNNFDINEEKIKSKNEKDYYQERKNYQKSMDKSIQTLIQLYEELKEKFDVSFIKDPTFKESIKEYYQNLINSINDFLENFKNFYNINEKDIKDKETKNENDFKEDSKLDKSENFFREILKNNYELIGERDEILVNCSTLFDQNSSDFFRINEEFEKYINSLKNLYSKYYKLYENIDKNELSKNCSDKDLYNNINNIKNDLFSNIEYIKQIYIDLDKRNKLINNKKKFVELKNFLLKELPTSENLLNNKCNLTNENFKNEIELFLKFVSEAIDQWNNSTSSILSDINDLFKQTTIYSQLTIPNIDNEKFENFVLNDDSFEFDELNNFVCINISKLYNLKEVLYNLINLQNKYELLDNELKERVNLENIEFWKNSLHSINSFNELRIINNQLNQDFEGIKKDYNENIDALMKYKYYLDDYNINLYEKNYANNLYQEFDKSIKSAMDKINKIVEIFKCLVDINSIKKELDIQNSLYKLTKFYREKNQIINLLSLKNELINLKLIQSLDDTVEIESKIDKNNDIINNINLEFDLNSLLNNKNNDEPIELFNSLYEELKNETDKNLKQLTVLKNENINKQIKYEIKQFLDIHDGSIIQIIKENIHKAMNIYDKLNNIILTIDYIFVLKEKYDNVDININNQNFSQIYENIISEINNNYSNYIKDIDNEVKLITKYIQNYEKILNNEVKKRKIDELEYYNEICEILFFIDNSKIRLSEFEDIYNDAVCIYKYHQEIVELHLKEKYYIKEMDNLSINKSSLTNNNTYNSNKEFSIHSESYNINKEKINNIEGKYQTIKNILSRNSIWDTELYNSILIINNNIVLQLWNDIENNLEINKNEENSINFISNESNIILKNLENLKNDINQIFTDSLNILIDNSINMNNNKYNELVDNFNNKYLICDQQCIKRFDNLINYYFNQNFKVKHINETVNDIHNILLQVNKHFYNQHYIFKFIEDKKLYIEKQFYIYSLLEKIDKLIEYNLTNENDIEFNIYLIKKYENEIQQFLVNDINKISWFKEIKGLSLINKDEKNQCLQYIISYNDKIYRRNLIINSKINCFMEKHDLTKYKYSFSRNSSIQNIYENTDLSNIK